MLTIPFLLARYTASLAERVCNARVESSSEPTGLARARYSEPRSRIDRSRGRVRHFFHQRAESRLYDLRLCEQMERCNPHRGEGNECGRSEYATSWAEQGPQGPKGDKGDQGPAGKDGEDGEQGPAGTPAGFRVIVQDGRIEHNQTRLFILPCPAGFFPTTGGIVYDVQKYPDFEAHQGSFTYIPASSTYPTAWTQLSRNNSDSQEANVQAWTLCAKIPG